MKTIQAVKKDLHALIRNNVTSGKVTITAKQTKNGVVCAINVRSGNFETVKSDLRNTVSKFENFGFFCKYNCNDFTNDAKQVNNDVNIVNIVEIFEEAKQAAKKAANEYRAKYGDRGACGFAWVRIETRSIKIRAKLQELGFYKPWGGKGLELWNPAGVPVQSVDCLELGAIEFARVFTEHGFTCYANSRLD